MRNHSDSWQLCFSLKIPFWEAHPFSEILSRLDTNFSAGFYLSISLIYFPFLCSGGRECPLQVLVAFSVNPGFMLFVQHLAQRSLLTPRALLSQTCWRNPAALGISLVHGAGEGWWLHVFAGVSGSQSALVKSWFAAVVHCKSGERDAERDELLSVRTGSSGSGL